VDKGVGKKCRKYPQIQINICDSGYFFQNFCGKLQTIEEAPTGMPEQKRNSRVTRTRLFFMPKIITGAKKERRKKHG
jgi:hypothetical protein